MKPPQIDTSLTIYGTTCSPTILQTSFLDHIHENYRDYVQVFTDGSKNPFGVGAAYYVPQAKVEKKLKLHHKKY